MIASVLLLLCKYLSAHSTAQLLKLSPSQWYLPNRDTRHLLCSIELPWVSSVPALQSSVGQSQARNPPPPSGNQYPRQATPSVLLLQAVHQCKMGVAKPRTGNVGVPVGLNAETSLPSCLQHTITNKYCKKRRQEGKGANLLEVCIRALTDQPPFPSRFCKHHMSDTPKPRSTETRRHIQQRGGDEESRDR